MVKRQKEKQYLSAREQKAQGRSRSNPSSDAASSSGVVQKSLPFKCCALTLVPFETPVCTVVEGDAMSLGSSNSKKASHPTTRYGIVFDNAALTEFVLKHKKDPVTGQPLKSSKIIKLHMDRDSETGQWQCPVLTKAFSDHHTKIVAVVSPSGGNEAYVYSYEAYHELNAKAKNYVDLTTGLKFSPHKDVLVLNDPSNANFQSKIRDVSNFWHIRNARSSKASNNTASSNNNNNIRKSVTATRVMEQIQKQKKEREEEQSKKAAQAAAAAASNPDAQSSSSFFEVPGSDLAFKVPTEDVTGVKYTSGSAALGLTSTAGSLSSTKDDDLRAATPEEILQSRLRLMKSRAWKGKKGYVNLVVEIRNGGNQGHHGSGNATSAPSQRLSLLLELHCDMVPRTCANFLGLCSQNRYDGTIFHRLIDDFMIQGGGAKHRQEPRSADKASKTVVDASLWGPGGFADEFDDRLKHTGGGGILAMANAGRNTNKQQFYITLGKACPHLDRKHSVFGTVAKGMDAFHKALASVRTDAKDRPYTETLDVTNGETFRSHAVVVIRATEVLENPYREAKEAEDKRLTELHELRTAKKKKRKRLVGGPDPVAKPEPKSRAASLGVGKYLSAKTTTTTKADIEQQSSGALEEEGLSLTQASSLPGLPEFWAIPPTKQKKKTKTKFGDFSSW